MAENTVFNCVKWAVEDLRAKGTVGFSSDVIRDFVLRRNQVISHAYLASCLNKLGYKYNRSQGIWRVDETKTLSSEEKLSNCSRMLDEKLKEINQHIKNTGDLYIENTKLSGRVKELEDRYEYLRGQVTELGKWVKNYLDCTDHLDPAIGYIASHLSTALEYSSTVKTRKDIQLGKIEDIIGEIVTNLLNLDYCSHCNKSWFCKHFNSDGNNKLANFLGVPDMCPAFERLIKDVMRVNEVLIGIDTLNSLQLLYAQGEKDEQQSI